MDLNGDLANTAYLDLAVVVRSGGGWLDLAARRLVVPPPAPIQAMRLVPRAPAFVDLPPT
jgi:hypothetical protein